MISDKAKVCWGHTIFTRKDRRVDSMEYLGYGAYFHYNRKSVLKYYRKQANRKLRRYKGDVSDFGWYKKFYDVQWNAF